MNRVLQTLNRRLDGCYQKMELTWARYDEDRKDNSKLHAYALNLRRARRLWSAIKTFSPNS
jgi:hypothetical protein